MINQTYYTDLNSNKIDDIYIDRYLCLMYLFFLYRIHYNVQKYEYQYN